MKSTLSDPVLARLDLADDALPHRDDDETIFCWEIALSHLAALLSSNSNSGNGDQTLSVLGMASLAEGHHLVLLVRCEVR